jgi:hypothetical protein
VPGTQQLRAPGQAQQGEQAARGEPLARAELEGPVQVVEERRAQLDTVDGVRAVHFEIGVALSHDVQHDASRGSGAIREPESGGVIPWHPQMIDGAARCHHRHAVAA